MERYVDKSDNPNPNPWNEYIRASLKALKKVLCNFTIKEITATLALERISDMVKIERNSCTYVGIEQIKFPCKYQPYANWNLHPTTSIIGAMLPSRTCGYVWLRTQVASLNWDTELSKQQGERDKGDYQPKLLILGDLIVQCCQCLYFSHYRKIKQSTPLTRTWGRNSEWVK